MQDPAQVARGLQEIAALLMFSGESRFKTRAYERAATLVATLGPDLASIVEQDSLRTLEGIGDVLSRQILELWNTGSSVLLQRLRRELPEGAAELLRVSGMTPRRIRALSAALGVRSVDDLLAACVARRVREVQGFGPKTEQRLLAACQNLRAQDPPALRNLLMGPALDLATAIRRELEKVLSQVEVAGAVRRSEETVGELELVGDGDVKAALAHLARDGLAVQLDAERGTARLAAGVPLRIHAAEPAFGSALFFATGDAAHVAAVCALARRQGFELPARAFATERELYASVGLPLVPPELRQGTDELERAARHELGELLELEHLRGFVHCHTTYSDGRNSVLEMAQAAHALGAQYITITDHSPSAHYAGGVTLDRLKQQWDEIDAAREQVPIRILRGTESDILLDGSLDFPDSVLERFDVIIASIHARHRLDRQRMTERLVRALSLPLFKIWGHGLGRILGHRPPIDCDVPAVLDALASSRGAIELNSDPHRLDLPACWVPAARERNIPFVISVDAHSTRGLGMLRNGVQLARRGGVLRQEVLNTRTPEEFAVLVKPV